MTITLIAAVSSDGFIARGGGIPWRLPDEVAHFRTYCQGKWLLIGRKTVDEMHGWFRPGQVPVIVTRDESLRVLDQGLVVHSVEEGIQLAQQHAAPELVVIGGGEIFATVMPFAGVLLLTEVHTILGGDVRFPPFPPDEWQMVESHHHPADANHALAFTIRRLVRRQP